MLGAVRLALVLAAAAALAACAAATPNLAWFDDKVPRLMDYRPRDDRVLASRYRDWMRLEFTGPRDAPVDSLWLALAPFGQRAAFNDIVVLSPDAYHRILLRMIATPCPPLAPIDFPKVKLTIAVAGRVTDRCLAMQPTACAFDQLLQDLTPDQLVSGELAGRKTFSDICTKGYPW